MRIRWTFLLGFVIASPTLAGAAEPSAPVYFESDVEPILTRFGCNAGACHGKQRGQNGFQLSLLGFDRDFDYAALTKEGRGRRVFPASPEHSLLLRKPSAQMPHGGGKRFATGSQPFEVLRRWIVAGAPRAPKDSPVLQRITIQPSERLLTFHAEQQLVVTAHFSDGSLTDVTRLAQFQSSESAVAAVNADGRIKA